MGGTPGQPESVHSTCLGAAGPSEALAWRVEGTFLTQNSPILGRCQVPNCANLGSLSRTPKKGALRKVFGQRAD